MALLAGVRRAGRALLRMPAPVTWGLIGLWFAINWTLSSRDYPRPDGLGSFAWRVLTNLAHAPVFGALALILSVAVLRGVPFSPVQGGPAYAAFGAWMRVRVIVSVAAFGILDEWHQSFVPGRDGTLADVGTDVTGALCVVCIVSYGSRSAASEGGIRARLLLGVLACVASAGAVAFAR